MRIQEADRVLPREYGDRAAGDYGRTVMRAPGGGGAGGGGAGRRRAPAALVISAVLILLVAVGIVRSGDDAAGIAYGAFGVASTLSVVLLGRRAPGPGAAIAGALSITAAAINPVPPVALFPFAIAIVFAAASGAFVWALVPIAVAYAVAITAVFVTADPENSANAARGFGTTAILLVAFGAGAFVRTRRTRYEQDLRLQADRQRIAIEEERLRIARELHDVLAHSLSSITVQAGVGLHLAADRPAAATEALETIRVASKEALDEVRGVLGLLRGDETAPLTPGPDLDALTPLVEETRRSGARVVLDDRLLPRPGRPVQLAVYRVVQESLTNARRHAPGAAIEIVLDREPDLAVVTIRDRGPAGAPPSPQDGNGITGMRERAAALGGTLALVPHDDGLEVVLRLPAPILEVTA